MIYSKINKGQILIVLLLIASLNLKSQSICTWHPEKKQLEFSLENIEGILNCDIQKSSGTSHHFSNVTHKPTGMKISPDGERMAGAGMLNFFRVLVEGGYLTELRVEEPLLEPT